MNDKVTITNISSATVVIASNELHFLRTLSPGRTVPIPRDIYEELIYDNGVMTLLKQGFIKFAGEGLDAVDSINEELSTETVSFTEIQKMLKKKDITAFSKLIPKASMATKESIVKYAVEYKITDNAFVALIKKYCNVDIIDAIAKEHQVKE